MTHDRSPSTPGVRPIGAFDTARLARGIERVLQRRAARKLFRPLRAHYATGHAVTSYPLSTELVWQGPDGPQGSTGCAVLCRVEGTTLVDLRLTGAGWRAAARAARAAGVGPGAAICTDTKRRFVLDLVDRTIAQARAALEALADAYAPGNPVETARHRHQQAASSLAWALETDLAHLVAERYPGAAWLVVDPEPWFSDPQDRTVALCAVLDADQNVLDDQRGPVWLPECERAPEPVWANDWPLQVEVSLTEIAELDGTSSWPELDGPDPDLRAVPLTPETALTVPAFTRAAWDDTEPDQP